jgi:hypothetical protein
MLKTFAFCVLGTFVSVTLIEFSVYRNPAKIPFRSFAFRASFGVILFLFLATGGSCLAFWGLRDHLQTVQAALGVKDARLLPLIIGLIMPQLIWLKDLAIQETAPDWLRPAVKIIVRISEATVVYVPKIINREERKVNFRYMQDCYKQPIDRLYELFVPSITLALAERAAKNGRPGNVVGSLKARQQDVRLKYLLRHFGCDRCTQFVDAVKDQPDAILPTWDPALGDRRTNSDRRKDVQAGHINRRFVRNGRRRVDSQFLKEAFYVLHRQRHHR